MSVLESGKKVPKVNALIEEGKKVSLEDIMGKNGIVLYFYPKDSTPGCTTEACDFRDNHSAIKKLGYEVVGISKDDLKSHKKFTEKQDLNFVLLSDDGSICEKFGVWAEKKMMGKKFMGIVRSTFIIGTDMKIKKVYSPVKVAGHVTQIINDIKELK